MKRFKLFVLSDCIIWGAVVALPTLSIIKAITYSLSTGVLIPPVGFIAMMLALVGFWGITLLRFYTRYQWIKSIRYYTRQGVAVICDVPWIEIYQRQANIEITIQAAIDFWKRVYTSDYQHEAIDSYIDGGVLNIKDQILEWHGRGDLAGMHKLALELTAGNNMAIGFTKNMHEITFYNLIRHAIGHVVINALRVSRSEQESHDIMNRNNYGA